jgi:hypothetical protein
MKKSNKIPVTIDNESQAIIEVKNENEFESVFNNFADPLRTFNASNLVHSSEKTVQHLTNALCILLGCKNGGLDVKAPKGKKVYTASAEHLSLDHASKQLAKQLKLQVKLNRKTVRFTQVTIKHKMHYLLNVKLYLEN